MDENDARPGRGRRLLTALAVAAAVAAVPAGVALAGGSGGSDQPSGVEAQSGPDTTDVQGQRDRDHDGRNCPKDKHGQPGSSEQGSGQQGSSEQGSGQQGTTQL